MSSRTASFGFLCRLLSPNTSPAEIRRLQRSISANAVDWESLIAIANHHLVTPALWVGLRQKHLDAFIDPATGQYLQELHALNQNRNRELKRQLLEAIALLNQKRIHPLIIKGGGQLLHPIQGDMAARIMTDLDLWVPPDQLSTAVEALTAAGYSDGGKTLKPYHHWAPLFRENEYGAIELHREVLPDAVATVLSAADICSRALDHVLQNLRFRTPNPAHAILLGMLHSQVKDRLHYEWSISLKSLNDAVAIVFHQKDKGGVDWQEIQTRMARCGLSPVLKTFLWSAYRLFNLPWPTKIRPTLGAIARHSFCMAAIQWPVVDRLAIKIDRCGRYVHRHFGGYQALLRYSIDRAIPF
jgi:hypothetical protein